MAIRYRVIIKTGDNFYEVTPSGQHNYVYLASANIAYAWACDYFCKADYIKIVKYVGELFKTIKETNSPLTEDLGAYKFALPNDVMFHDHLKKLDKDPFKDEE